MDQVQPTVQRRALVKVFLVLILIFILVWLLSNPVLIRLKGPLKERREWILFNPIRDREPERTAETFLEEIRNGRCKEMISALDLEQQDRENICIKEKEYPLLSWRLRDREDKGHQSSLSFWYVRAGYNVEDELFIWVEKRGQTWQVIAYRSVY